MFTNAANFIIEGIKNIFVPREDFLTEKVETIKSHFGFYSSIVDTVEVFKDFFSQTFEGEPPKITVDLSDSESKYNYGETAYVLDMTWYARFKPYGDKILSAIMLVFFAWRMFKALPSIISGGSTLVNMADSSSGGKE